MSVGVAATSLVLRTVHPGNTLQSNIASPQPSSRLATIENVAILELAFVAAGTVTSGMTGFGIPRVFLQLAMSLLHPVIMFIVPVILTGELFLNVMTKLVFDLRHPVAVPLIAAIDGPVLTLAKALVPTLIDVRQLVVPPISFTPLRRGFETTSVRPFLSPPVTLGSPERSFPFIATLRGIEKPNALTHNSLPSPFSRSLR